MIRVDVVPCLRDNYAYLLVDESVGDAIVVDPSEAMPIQAAVAERGLRVVRVLATHHHADHVGGAPALCARFGVPLELHRVDAGRLGALGVGVVALDGDHVSVFADAEIRLHHVPGHTLGAACFAVHEAGALPRLFTGDTLFLGGCGRVFEGDPPMLRASLERIAALAPEALVYCGHEYTAANLRFACAVDPSNALVREALARAESSGRTVPGRLTVERACNPFLRASLDVEFVVDGVTMRGDPDTVFAALRASKNLFRAT